MNLIKSVSPDLLAKFTFVGETLNLFKSKDCVPFDLYNAEGNLLFEKKKHLTREDYERLLKFELHGIFILVSELNRLKEEIRGGKNDKHNLQIVNREKIEKFTKQTNDFLEQLRKEAFSSSQAIYIQNSIQEILTDFMHHPEFESGFFNLLEILGSNEAPLRSELMTKRTIVAMGMKIKAKNHVSSEEISHYRHEYLAVMMASYLADIGYSRLDLNEEVNLTKADYQIIKQHPIISYLMTLSAREISSEIRTLILNHHRPFHGVGLSNNFPSTRSTFTKLMAVRDKYSGETNKERIIEDIEKQLFIQQHQVMNATQDEDIAILSLSSEYASLTTNQAWRPAYNSSQALKIIVNNSFFSYNNKNMRLLLDYIGSGLNHNERIINPGDFLITTSLDSENHFLFDLCMVHQVDRFQSLPILQRIGSIKPVFKKTHKYSIDNFDLSQIRIDRRKPLIDLGSQAAISQRIIYIIDKELNPAIYETAGRLIKN